MNRKDGDNPNHLEEPGDLLNAEFLNKLNHLLEQLHQSGNSNHGSKIEFVYVASGGQHIETIQTQNITCPTHPKRRENGTENVNTAQPDCMTEGEEESTSLPEALSTEEAMVLWEKVQRAGYVNENYQPLISRTQSALLADAIAERLGIREKWKMFEALWNRKNMYRDYYKALNLLQSLDFQDKIKRTLR